MIVGSGIDLVEIARVARALERRGARILRRVYTERERADCERRAQPAPWFALRFAVKAGGTGWRRGVGWRDFELLERERGYELRLTGRALEVGKERGFDRAWVATSLTRTHALAHVVLERTR